MSIYKYLFFFICSTSLSFGNYEAAKKLRNQIQWNEQDSLLFSSVPVEPVVLKTTKGFDQSSSQFCWVFSTLNMLETNYLMLNPNIEPSAIELSRWFFYEATKSLGRRGTTADALFFYSPKIGFVPFNSYIKDTIPSEVTFLDKKMSPKDLRNLMIGDQEFWSYGFSEDVKGWAQHPDPDALKGTLSYYVHPSKKSEILEKSLRMGKAVEFSQYGHSLIVYGAEFDSNGRALKYFIKDSYPGYFYTASADKLHSAIWELTTVAQLVE